jgi:peptidoglycan/xylan/chitin deacetylase (PgdA/CDA1 family)
VGLTFDDGYADFATTAVPILRRYGFTATVYVLADRLGGGSHGLRHVSLPTVSQGELTAEVAHSRKVLGELLEQEISGFAYPGSGMKPSSVRQAPAGYDSRGAPSPKVRSPSTWMPSACRARGPRTVARLTAARVPRRDRPHGRTDPMSVSSSVYTTFIAS